MHHSNLLDCPGFCDSIPANRFPPKNPLCFQVILLLPGFALDGLKFQDYRHNFIRQGTFYYYFPIIGLNRLYLRIAGIRSGLSAVATPAFSRAFIFSRAVPSPPSTIAPA
jgi:hypothetical protein